MNYLHLNTLKLQLYLVIFSVLVTLVANESAQAKNKTANIISFQRCAQLLDLSAGSKLELESLPIHKVLYELWESANKKMWIEVQKAKNSEEGLQVKKEELDKKKNQLDEMTKEYSHLVRELNLAKKRLDKIIKQKEQLASYRTKASESGPVTFSLVLGEEAQAALENHIILEAEATSKLQKLSEEIQDMRDKIETYEEVHHFKKNHVDTQYNSIKNYAFQNMMEEVLRVTESLAAESESLPREQQIQALIALYSVPLHEKLGLYFHRRLELVAEVQGYLKQHDYLEAYESVFYNSLFFNLKRLVQLSGEEQLPHDLQVLAWKGLFIHYVLNSGNGFTDDFNTLSIDSWPQMASAQKEAAEQLMDKLELAQRQHLKHQENIIVAINRIQNAMDYAEDKGEELEQARRAFAE